MSEKKEWSTTISLNRKLFPKTVKNNELATQMHTKFAGSVLKAELPKPKERRNYKQTNSEAAKELGVSERQISKMRNGRKPFLNKEN